MQYTRAHWAADRRDPFKLSPVACGPHITTMIHNRNNQMILSRSTYLGNYFKFQGNFMARFYPQCKYWFRLYEITRRKKTSFFIMSVQ